jgi:SOS response regulatory protein OraA/RecX
VPRTPPDPEQLTPAAARLLVLRWLGTRELTAAQIRARLRRRHFPDTIITPVLENLTAKGLIDDLRAARANARHGAVIRRHGRGRVLREVQALGVDRDTARAAVASAFDEVDEDQLLATVLARRLRGAPVPSEPKARNRLFTWLLRQGYDADRIRRVLHARPEPDAE